MSLENIKVGDRVALSQKFGGQTIRSVVRVTPKQVFVESANKSGEMAFWKSSGNAVGSSGERFGGDRIFIPSPEAMAKLEEAEARRRAIQTLRHFDFTEVPTKILVAAAADLEASGARLR